MAPAGCTVRFAWGDGDEHAFALPIGALRELDEKLDAGPEELLARLTILPEQQGGVAQSIALGLLRPRPNDLREILRCGLVGAGMAPTLAAAKIKRYVDGRPRSESYMAARAVLLGAVIGVPDDPPGKQAPPTTGESGGATQSSDSASSTAPAVH